MSLQGTLEKSGLEYKAAILDGAQPTTPLSRVMRYALHTVNSGRIVFCGAPEFDNLNPMAAGTAPWSSQRHDLHCYDQSAERVGLTTLEYKVNLVRPVPLDTPVKCVGETDHVRRSTGVAHGRLIGLETGTTYAARSSTCPVMKMA